MANQMVVLDNTSADPRNWKVDYTVDNPGAAIATLETAGTLVDRNIQIVVNTPAGGATVSGGTLSVTNNYSATPTVNLTLEGQTTTGITLQSSAPAAGYYVEISGKTSALFGTTTVNRAATSLELTSGYVSGQTFSSVLTSTSASPTVSISSATSIGYLKLPTATFAASGSSIYSSAAGWVAANQPINSITVGTLSAMTTAVSNAQVSLKGNGIAAGNSASPYYISLNTTAGSVTPRVEVTSDGYVTEIQNTNGTPVSVDITGKDSKYYLPTNTISASVSDLTSGSVTITTALTGITTTSTNTGYKITIGSTVSTGSVKGQASAGATTGVVAANAFAVSNATTITPSVTGTTSFYLPASTLSLSGGGLTPNAGSATLYNGGYYNGTNYAVNDTIDLGTTATTGYYQLVVEGKGTVSRAAITGSITTGYTTANSTSIATTSISSTTSTAYYYIKKSTLSAASVTPSTTTATVTVTSGYYKDDRTITIAAMTTVTPTTSYTNSGLSTYFTAGTSSDYNVAITPRYSNSAGYVTAHTNTNNGGIEYWKITTAKLSQGSTTTSGTSATRGIASIATSGWIEATTISAAKFASSATSGISYIDISNTTEAPALVAGDYLYINKGYTDNLKISLAKLLPGEATITGSGASYASNQMLNGVTAYDTEGHLITGNILTRDSGNVSETRTATSGYVTVTSGYYASNVTKALTSGAYSADSSTSTNSEVTPSVSITSASTYGFATSTAGMGTYLTINPGATATDWSVTPRAKITTSGYLPTGNTTGTAVSGSPSIKDGTNYYVPVASYTFSCGTTTASIASNTITVTGMNTTTTNTGYKIEATAAGTYDFGAVTYTNTAGVTAAHGTAQSVKARSSGSMTSKSATTAYIAAAAIASTGSINNTTVTTTPGTVSIADNNTAVTGKTRLTTSNFSIGTTTANISTYYIALKATAAANSTGTTGSITGTTTASISTSGYAPTTLTTSASLSATATAKTSAKDSSVYYIAIPTATLSTSTVTPTTSEQTVTIGAGYYPDSRTITVGPASAGGTGEVTPGFNNANLTTYFNTTSTTTGSISITPKYSNTAGYIGAHTDTTGTTSYYNIKTATFTNSGASVKSSAAGWVAANTTVGTISNGTLNATLSANTSGSASMGTTTMTTAASSNYYVTLTTNAGSVTPKAGVTTAGYVSISTSATGTATSVGVTGNGNKLYIAAASVTPNVGTTNLTTYFDTAAANATTGSIAILPRYTNTSGYIPANSSNVNGTTAYYNIKSATFTSDGASIKCSTAGWITAGTTAGTVSNGALNATISSNTSGSAAMGTTTMSTAASSNYYVTLTTTAGSVTPKAGVQTAGYVTTTTSATGSSTNVGVTGNGSKLYIKEGSTVPTYVQTNLATYFSPTTATTGSIGIYARTTNTDGYISAGTITGNTQYYNIKSATFTTDGASIKCSTAGWIDANTTAGTIGTATLNASLSNNTSGSAAMSTTLATGTSANSTYYVTLTTTAGSVTPKAGVTTAGYASTTTSATGSATSVGVTGNGSKLYIAAASVSTGGGAVSVTNYTGKPVVTLASGSSTNMANITMGAQDTTNYPYYFKVQGNTSALSGSTTVSMTSATVSYTSGYTTARTTTAKAAFSSSPTVTVSASDTASSYVSLKKATMTVAKSTGTITPTASMAGTNATLSDTNNGIAIVATGGGSASLTATATTNAAGYAPASTQLGSASLSISSTTTAATKYISGVKLTAPTSGTRSFTITVPNGNTTDFIDFVFTVDTSGNVVVAEVPDPNN